MKKLIFGFVLVCGVFMTNLFSWHNPSPEYEYCFGKCEIFLGKDKYGQGKGFINCMNDCMIGMTQKTSPFSFISIFSKGK